jgi:predicted HTH transcriptional regulator
MKHETNRIEYKQQLTEDLEKEAVAFLNYNEGGIIYIGIDNNGKAIGVVNIDSTCLKIKDRLKNNIMPSCMGLFDVSIEKKTQQILLKSLLLAVLKNRTISRNLGCRKKEHLFVLVQLLSLCQLE